MHKTAIFPGVLLLTVLTTANASSPSQFDQVCKTLLSNPNSQVGSGSGDQQKLQYCQAAAGAQSGVTSNSIIWKLWAGVAAVCTTACFSPVVGPLICTGSTIGATVTDVAVTKNFANALVGVGGVAGSVLLGGNSGSSGIIKSKGSCLAAATAALQSMTHHSDMSNEQSQLNQNVADAQALGGGGPGVPVSMASAPAMNSQPGVNSANANSPAPPQTTGEPSGPALQAALDLAVSSGKIPKSLADPQFQKDFKNATGASLGDFLKQSPGSPATAIEGLLGETLSSTDSGKLASALDEMKQELIISPPSGIRGPFPVAKVAGAGTADNGEEMDFSKALSGLIGQFKGPDPSHAVQNSLEFKPAKFAGRTPAAIEADPTISIFERITYRYSSLSQQLAEAGH